MLCARCSESRGHGRDAVGVDGDWSAEAGLVDLEMNAPGDGPAARSFLGRGQRHLIANSRGTRRGDQRRIGWPPVWLVRSASLRAPWMPLVLGAAPRGPGRTPGE